MEKLGKFFYKDKERGFGYFVVKGEEQQMKMKVGLCCSHCFYFDERYDNFPCGSTFTNWSYEVECIKGAPGIRDRCYFVPNIEHQSKYNESKLVAEEKFCFNKGISKKGAI